MIPADLLELLCCPVTHQRLAPADDGLLHRLNSRIDSAEPGLCNIGGEKITVPLEEALVRADGTLVYPIRDGVPVLLANEAIAVG